MIETKPVDLVDDFVYQTIPPLVEWTLDDDEDEAIAEDEEDFSVFAEQPIPNYA